eukprot:5578691-Pleurochrysis_carterae.AAC.3
MQAKRSLQKSTSPPAEVLEAQQPKAPVSACPPVSITARLFVLLAGEHVSSKYHVSQASMFKRYPSLKLVNYFGCCREYAPRQKRVGVESKRRAGGGSRAPRRRDCATDGARRLVSLVGRTDRLDSAARGGLRNLPVHVPAASTSTVDEIQTRTE